jgi:hypothetical protein
MRRVLLALSACLILAPVAAASTATTATELTKSEAISAFLHDGKVAHWIKHYPRTAVTEDAAFSPSLGLWRVDVSSGRAGVVATGRVSDATGAVTEAWTGAQVLWPMGRGYKGLFGGRLINSWPVWLGFCLIFLVGLANLRRPLSLRNLDLVALLSFSVSLWFFNRGDIFTSVPLVYPPLLYLLGRCAWIGWRGRSPAESRPVWPVWLLVAATFVLMGVRIGLNVYDSNVIDVGLAGVIGAGLISHHDSPYGNFPATDEQRNVLPPHLDTYGPVAYEAYLPAFALFGWNGHYLLVPGAHGTWSEIPAAHFTAIALDVACLLLVALLGWRMAGRRLAATLAFAWAAFPFTEYALSTNSNDALPPAFLIAGLILVAFPWARGGAVALSGWTKFGSLLLAPLWASYPDGLTKPKAKAMFAVGFLVATYVVFWVLLLKPHHPLHAAGVFYRQTIKYQLGRPSPFSVWDWRQYHAAGIPDLHRVQQALEVLVAVAAIGLYFVPRRKTPLQLAALTGFLVLAFELVLTYWFYLYIPWFFPFVAVAVLAGHARLEMPPTS